MENVSEFSIPFIVYGLSIWAIGFVFLAHDVIKGFKLNLNVQPSKISWLDFGILLWLIIVILFVSQNLWPLMIKKINLDALILSTPGFISQILVLFFIFFTFKKYSWFWSPPINSVNSTPKKAILWGVYFFFGSVPLVWFTSLCWTTFLKLLQHYGWITEVDFQPLVHEFAKTNSIPLMLAIGVIATFVAPVTEEFIFRVGVYRFLKGKFNYKIALVSSAFIFALVHAHLTSFLALFLLGLLLARSYERSGHILTAITFHFLFNINTLILILIEPNLTQVGL